MIAKHEKTHPHTEGGRKRVNIHTMDNIIPKSIKKNKIKKKS